MATSATNWKPINNKDANYFSTVGGYRGAYRKGSNWKPVGGMNRGDFFRKLLGKKKKPDIKPQSSTSVAIRTPTTALSQITHPSRRSMIKTTLGAITSGGHPAMSIPVAIAVRAATAGISAPTASTVPVALTSRHAIDFLSKRNTTQAIRELVKSVGIKKKDQFDRIQKKIELKSTKFIDGVLKNHPMKGSFQHVSSGWTDETIGGSVLKGHVSPLSSGVYFSNLHPQSEKFGGFRKMGKESSLLSGQRYDPTEFSRAVGRHPDIYHPRGWVINVDNRSTYGVGKKSLESALTEMQPIQSKVKVAKIVKIVNQSKNPSVRKASYNLDELFVKNVAKNAANIAKMKRSMGPSTKRLK